MDELITALKGLLEAALGSSYTVIYGQVKIPDDTMFPLVEIVPINTVFQIRGTGKLSQGDHIVQINYKNSLKNFVDSDTDQTIVKHIQDAVKVMEERDDTTHMPLSSTILGCLIDNMKISGVMEIPKNIEISYNINEYDGSWIINASLVFTGKKITPINC